MCSSNLLVYSYNHCPLNDLQYMNIILSGWPGAGTTSISLMMAYLLKYEYVYAGGVMKHIAESHVGATSGPNYISFEESFGPQFDQIWEKYAVWKLKTANNLLMEAKTAGFFIGDENVFEVMLIAGIEARIKRAQLDKREDAGATIRARDAEVRQRWFSTFNIDIYNLNTVRENYDLVIDNSHMEPQDELEILFRAFEDSGKFPGVSAGEFRDRFAGVIDTFWDKGKDYYREELIKAGLYTQPQKIIQEWEDNFPDELKELGLNVRSLI